MPVLLVDYYTDLTNTDQDDSQIPALEDSYDNPNDGIFTNASYDDEGAVADFTNLETIVNVSPIPTSRIHSIHPSTQILRDPKSVVQTRSKVNKSSRAYAFVDAMQEELLQFKIQKVWILVDLPYGKKGHRQEEGIDYDEVFAHVARIEAIRIFLAFASYMGFIVYQMNLKSAFPYGTIDEESVPDLDSVHTKDLPSNCIEENLRRLISWQCKMQTIVTTSTTEAEYVAVANCCRQVLWIQNC
ncbi:putative ribonuclease H-like domain-containing protein [Tanacetum coccineum]